MLALHLVFNEINFYRVYYFKYLPDLLITLLYQYSRNFLIPYTLHEYHNKY